MKFLIIDDSVTMRKVIALALKSINYDYSEAENGEKALELLSNNTYDFFLIDLNMPGMNGIELVKEIKKNPRHAKIPIIILTTEQDEKLKNESKNSGANDWITKPFQKEQLIELINKYKI